MRSSAADFGDSTNDSEFLTRRKRYLSVTMFVVLGYYAFLLLASMAAVFISYASIELAYGNTLESIAIYALIGIGSGMGAISALCITILGVLMRAHFWD